MFLVSPPGMTFGYRVSDWPLFRTGFINEMKMALCTFIIGCIVGLILGDVGELVYACFFIFLYIVCHYFCCLNDCFEKLRNEKDGHHSYLTC
jgi:hypothetical protein